MRQKCMGRLVAFVLVLAMIFSSGTMPTAVVTAKAKAPKLSKKSVSLKVGQTKKVTVKNKPKKAKVSWSSKNKKIATVKNGKIKGVKVGNTKVTAKVTYKKGKKKVTKKLTVSVKVTKKAADQTPTSTPSVPTGGLNDSNLTDEHLSRNGITTRDNGLMRANLSAQDITPVMGLGWNVGNSLEQVSAGSCVNLSPEEQAKLTDADWVQGYETNAGNAVSRQRLFDGLKRYGINTIRIPIAWSNMMSTDGNYTINEAYFNRVEEVMNYCLNNEMYVIINDHWDNQWWGMFGDKDPAVREQAWKKYESMWKQIAERYQEYSDRVIFEGANEELGERLNDDWLLGNGEEGVLTPEETFALTNQINQKFVDIIRSSGINADGTKNNNYYRMLLIPGYDTNLHQTCGDKYSDKVKENNDALTFTMPTDVEGNIANRFFVSIHYYDPLGWGIMETVSQGTWDAPKGPTSYTDTWGINEDGSRKQEDYDAMQEDFDAVNEAYIKKGYGVIFGEFGVVSVNKDGIPDYYREFFKKSKEYTCVPIMWDAGGLVDRKGTGNANYAYFIYEDIGAVICESTGAEVKLRDDAMKTTALTGKAANIVSENQDPLVVATWEGDFMRNTTASKSVDLDGIRKMFGDEFIMDMADGTRVGAYFNTKAITYHPDYTDLTLTATSDAPCWHSHFRISDWSRLEKPSIRITMHDDDISKAAQLQLVYTNGMWDDGKDYDWRYEADYEQAVWGVVSENDDLQMPLKDADGNLILSDNPWQDKVLLLNTKYMETEPVIMLTTNTFLGVDFVKVEFCDAAYNADGTPFQSGE